LIPKLTRLDLLACDALAREAEDLPEMRRRFVEIICRVRFVYKQIAAGDKLEYLKVGSVSGQKTE